MPKSRTLTAQKVVSDITVNSAWDVAYFPLDEGSISANTDISSLTITDPTVQDTNTTAWTDNPNWFSGVTLDANNAVLTVATEPDLDTLFDLRGGRSLIIGFQVFGQSTGSTRDILHIGGNVTTSKSGIWIFQHNTSSKVTVRIDDETTQFSDLSPPATYDLNPSNVVYNVIVQIDGENQQAQIYTNIDGTTALVGSASPVDISTMDFNTMLPSAQSGTPALRIHENGSSSSAPGDTALRRLWVINFGTGGLPSNIETIRNRMHLSHMLPTWELED